MFHINSTAIASKWINVSITIVCSKYDYDVSDEFKMLASKFILISTIYCKTQYKIVYM